MVEKIDELLCLKKFCILQQGNLRMKQSSNRKRPQRKETSEKLLPRCYPRDFLRIEPTWEKEELNK